MLNGTKNEFRKQDTTAIKGIAIIMLLFYHCFSTADRFAGYDISFLLPQNIEMWLCNACNVCVGMFAVLSAYGITIASKKMLEERDYRRYFVHRYLSLMKGFWIAFAFATVISAILGKLSAYGSGLTFILNFVSELSGLAYILQTSSLCGTWWYISFTVMLIVMIPFVDIIYQKWGGGTLILILFLAFFLIKPEIANMTKWIGAIIIGYLAAENNLFVRLSKFKLCRNSTWNFAAKFAIDILVLIALIWFRQEVETDSYLVLLKYNVVPFWVVYFCYRYIVSIPGISTVLQWIGKHSMNIFLVHTFYRWIWCRDFIYGLKYDMLIILTLFVVSVITSIALERLKKWIRWDKMIGRLEQRLLLHPTAQ